MLKRQSLPSHYVLYDDQSNELANAYNGSWVHVNNVNSDEGFIDDTYTLTNVSGSTFEFSFNGTMAIVYGGVINGTTYPQATFSIDGSSAGSMSPYIDNKQVVYFEFQNLTSSLHSISVNVTAASNTSPFILDALLLVPASSGNTSTTVLPSNTTAASPGKSHIGIILAGILGGTAVLIGLVYIIISFLRRRRDRLSSGEQPPEEADPAPVAQSLRHSRASSRRQSRAEHELNAAISYRKSDLYHSGARSSYYAARRQSDITGLSSPVRGEGGTDTPLVEQTSDRKGGRTVRHSDSGIRFGEGVGISPAILEVPPNYSAS